MTNKTALVTGGSRGIGKCVVDLLRAHGWDVIAPTRAEFDMDESNSVLDSFKVMRNKLPDAVVFCHGEWYSEELEEMEWSAWIDQYEQRVVNPIKIIQYLLLNEIPKDCVIMVSSTRGFIGGVDTGPYSAACAAQIALMQGYAREYQGVRFNCVAPGLTDTDMGQDVIKTGGAKPGAAMQPPEVVASAIVGLIESDADGEILRVVDSQITKARWVWE